MLKIDKQELEEGRVLLTLSGEATIEHVQELHQLLRKELSASQQLLINCEKTDTIDNYAMQLLCSAHRSALAWDKSVSFDGTISAALQSALRKSGFYRDRGCSLCPSDTTCLWMATASLASA